MRCSKLALLLFPASSLGFVLRGITTAPGDTESSLLPYPNIGYLGSGYDIVFGNPDGDADTQLDPGFREPVVKLTWDQSKDGSRDLRWLTPKEGYAREVYSCHSSSEVATINSISDLQETLKEDCAKSDAYSVDVSVSSSAVSASSSVEGDFSASNSFKDFVEERLSKDVETYQIKSYCIQYQAGIDPNSQWTVLPLAKAAMDKLDAWTDTMEQCNPKSLTSSLLQEKSETQSDGIVKTRKPPKKKAAPSSVCSDAAVQRWFRFFQTYGTHLVVDIKFGGKFEYSLEIEKSDANKLRQSNVDIAKAFSQKTSSDTQWDSGLGVSGSVSSSVSNAGSSLSSSDKKAMEQLTQANKVETIRVLGGLPPRDPSGPAAFSDWSKTVSEKPMPVKYQVAPIAVAFPKDKQASALKAMAWYKKGLATDFQNADMFAVPSASDILLNGKQGFTNVRCTGTGTVDCSCPAGKTITYGFGFSLDPRGPAGTTPPVMCTPGQANCIITKSNSATPPRCTFCNDKNLVNCNRDANAFVDGKYYKAIRDVKAADGENMQDDIESSSCDAGCTGTLWQDENKGGDSTKVTGRYNTLAEQWSDAVSSLAVSCEDSFVVQMVCGAKTLADVTQVVTMNSGSSNTASMQCPSGMVMATGVMLSMNGFGSYKDSKISTCPAGSSKCTSALPSKWEVKESSLQGWALCMDADLPGIEALATAATVKGTKAQADCPAGKKSFFGSYGLLGTPATTRKNWGVCPIGKTNCNMSGGANSAMFAWVACADEI